MKGFWSLTWAEGTLWVGQYRDRKIHQIDPQTGKILRTIESNRFACERFRIRRGQTNPSSRLNSG